MPSASADRSQPTLRPAPSPREGAGRVLGPASLLLTLLLLLGCTPTSGPPAPRWEAEQAASTLQRWGAAALVGDRAGYDAEVSLLDPGFVASADQLFDNLSRLGWLRLELGTDRVGPRRGREAVLGEHAVVVAAEVAWSATPADPTADPPPDTQRHRVWLTWVRQQGRWLIAGTADGPTGRQQPSPLWWWEPVTVEHQDGLTLLSGAEVDWGPRTRRAWVAAVRGVGESPGGRPVVQVPSSSLVLARVLGTEDRVVRAAITLADPDGVHPVLVDPAANLSETGWELVLTHELVHVLTDSPGSGSPRWLVEGLAESVAREAYPQVVTGDPETARTALQQPGLPADAELAEGSATAYLRSWVAVRLLQRQVGRPALLELLAGTADGEPVEPQLLSLDASTADLEEQLRQTLQLLAEGETPAVLR